MFEWDIFVSYGWSGNAAGEGDIAWVEELSNQLRIALRNRIGRDLKIFRDLDATRAGPLTDVLESAVDHSRLFLFVVSPGSCQSPWCLREILRFFDHANSAASRNEVLLPEDRVLGVRLATVPPEHYPAPLQPLIFRPFDLTRRIEGREGRRPVEWHQLDDEKLVRAEFDRLVNDLADRLKAIELHEARAVPATGVTVFLGTAPTPLHEKHYLTPLRRDLLLRGHRVTRVSAALGETEEEYRIRLGAELSQARHSVHILGEPLARPGWRDSLGAWQRKLAADHSRTMSRFIWEDSDGTPDLQQRSETLQPGDHQFDRRQPFSELRTALLDRAGAAKVASPAEGKSVVIAYCEEDRQYASEIMRRLRQQLGLQAQLGRPPSEKASQHAKKNSGLFAEMDAVLVYCSTQEDWMMLTCQSARLVFRKRGSKPAALVLHPAPPPKDDWDQAQFATILRAHEEDFSELDRWARALQANGAGA